MAASKNETDPSSARKRRMKILANTRQSSKRSKTSESENDSCQGDKPKTKYQNRYEPDVPMTKEEAAEWRREARRKRNRESAAASRNKVRSRIAELEGEVDQWKEKYYLLLARIEKLENAKSNGSGSSALLSMISNLPQQSQGLHAVQATQGHVSPCTTPGSLPKVSVDFNALSNEDSLQIDIPFDLTVPSLELQSHIANLDTDVNAQNDHVHSAVAPNAFHVIEMTSRPAQSN